MVLIGSEPFALRNKVFNFTCIVHHAEQLNEQVCFTRPPPDSSYCSTQKGSECKPVSYNKFYENLCQAGTDQKTSSVKIYVLSLKHPRIWDVAPWHCHMSYHNATSNTFYLKIHSEYFL